MSPWTISDIWLFLQESHIAAAAYLADETSRSCVQGVHLEKLVAQAIV